MNRTEIYLLRHAVTDYNQGARFQGISDIPLNADGFAQAEMVRERFLNAGVKPDYLISSDLIRTRQTVEPLAKALKMEILQMPEFREVDGGIFEGRPHIVNAQEYPEVMDNIMVSPYHVSFPKGESGKDVYDRAVKAFQSILAQYPGKTIIIVSHGFFLQMLRSYILGIPPEKTERLICANTAVTKLFWSEADGMKVEYLFDAGHLPERWQASNEAKATRLYFEHRDKLR